MKISYLLLFFCLLTIHTIGQDKKTDSLKTLMLKSNTTIERFGLLNKLYDHQYNNSIKFSKEITSIGIEMFQIAQKTQNDSLLAISLNIIGTNFRDKEDNPTALEYYFKAIPLAKKSNDKRRLSSLYFDVSGIYSYLGDQPNNYKYIKKGGENLPDKNSPMYLFMALQYNHVMANYLLDHEEPKKALVFIRNAENENALLMNDRYRLIISTLYGRAYRKMSDNDMADTYYQRSLAIANSSNDPIQITSVKFSRAYHLFTMGQFDELNKVSHELMKIAKHEKHISNQQYAAEALKELYIKTNQIDSAFFYSQLETTLKDSIMNKNKSSRIQALTFKTHMSELEEKAKEERLEEERIRNIQYLFISVGIISLIVVLILLTNSIIINERWISFLGILSLLLVFEFINLLIHPYLEELTHHSPILMLCALVLLASLLIPLHHKLEKLIKEKMIKKNRITKLAIANKIINESKTYNS